jgi:2'-5' RNA ligase
VSQPERLRLFVAVRVPEPHLRQIDTQIESFKRRFSEARWIPVENQHVTLKFLGSTPTERLDAVKKVLRVVAVSHAAARVSLTQVGAFPSAKRARVLWVGLADPSRVLVALASDVERGLEPLGYPAEERAFTPHLTLARYRVPARLADVLPRLDHDLEPFTVDRLVLFRSRLLRSGARYEPLDEFWLREPRPVE